MKNRRLAVLFIGLGLAMPTIALDAAQRAASAKVFKAGAATSNISPPLGTPRVGGWEAPLSVHIHDELHVRCLVLDDGATRLAFAVVDSVGVPRSVFDAAKRLITEATGIPADHLMMSATHTHRGVSASGADSRVLGAPFDSYQNFLVQRIADGVRRAVNHLEPARIAWGTGQVPQHVGNRRWLLKDGETVVNPFGGRDRGINHPYGDQRSKVTKPAGPVNPDRTHALWTHQQRQGGLSTTRDYPG